MLDINLIITFLVIGAVVGMIAGLLGVGGGGVLVPTLSYVFLNMGIAPENVMHLALGTSMACIIVTSMASLHSHHRKGAVRWELVKIMSFGIILGTFSATFIASYVNAVLLALIFSSFMFWTAIKMIRSKVLLQQKHELNIARMCMVSTGIGAMSALVSIGGGSLTMPYLLRNKVEMKVAIGTSAAIGLPISISATLGYLLNGWDAKSEVAFTWGFVYWPAAVFISITSFVCVPLGVKLAHYLPVMMLKSMFAWLLILLSIKMLFFMIYGA